MPPSLAHCPLSTCHTVLGAGSTKLNKISSSAGKDTLKVAPGGTRTLEQINLSVKKGYRRLQREGDIFKLELKEYVGVPQAEKVKEGHPRQRG